MQVDEQTGPRLLISRARRRLGVLAAAALMVTMLGAMLAMAVGVIVGITAVAVAALG